MTDFEIEIASIPTNENLVAEIFYKDEQWVEISQEPNNLVIKFFSPNNQKYWEFGFSEAMEILEEAKNKLLG